MTPEQMKEFIELCMDDAIQTRWAGPWREGDMAWNEGIRIVDDPDNFEYGDWLWLPPVYDDQNLERSLWGMVDWTKWYSGSDLRGHYSMTWEGKGAIAICDPLPIALARAVIWQHERRTE